LLVAVLSQNHNHRKLLLPVGTSCHEVSHLTIIVNLQMTLVHPAHEPELSVQIALQ
jgi:hypothetical protein